jgi:hypothetical protein
MQARAFILRDGASRLLSMRVEGHEHRTFHVITGLVPVISLRDALCPPKRDARHKAGHDVERLSLDVDAPVIAT